MASFIKPNQLLGQEFVIPPEILRNAKGLAIITQIKAGFLFSGRAGSGVIVARLPDGSWSAPSAIVTAGAGVGGQIGAEITDFIFILNNQKAVDTFSHAGSITLGGNISVAAGPLGRNAEVAGSASRSSVAAIFSYSKTKGLFAGVSLEGSVLIERREANRKFYGKDCTAKLILSGRVEPPPEADVLFRVLESRAFRSSRDDYGGDDFYDDIPDDISDSSSSYSRGRSSRKNSVRRGYDDYDDDDYDYEYGSYRSNNGGERPPPNRSSKPSWQDDYYDEPSNISRRNTTSSRVRGSPSATTARRGGYDDYDDDEDIDRLGDRFSKTGLRSSNTGGHNRPTAPKPRWKNETPGYDEYSSSSRVNNSRRYDDDDDDYYYDGNSRRPSSRGFTKASNSSAPQRYDEERRIEKDREVERRREASTAGGEKAVALYTFNGEQGGDLDFRKGDIITIVKRSESKDDWWTGRRGNIEGIFPANYVELV